jgi:hypothetical protein
MSRRHTDPIEVRTRVEESGPVPDQFLWRGRLYCVREVLARWTESGAWWRGTAVRSLTSGGDAAVATAEVAAGVDDGETHWWRVEADSDRRAALSGGGGTYDLCFDWSAGSWSLKRVMD